MCLCCTGTLSGPSSFYGDDDDDMYDGNDVDPLYDSDTGEDQSQGTRNDDADKSADASEEDDDDFAASSFPKARLLDAPLELVRQRTAYVYTISARHPVQKRHLRLKRGFAAGVAAAEELL